MEQFTRTLDEITGADLATVGGKGANLGELVAAGLDVPDGFCVTTAAYRSFVRSARLQPTIAEHLRSLDAGTDIGAACAAIRRCFTDTAMPATIAEPIRFAYDALDRRDGRTPAVSVRSSATAEDLPGASFAGQQDTYLHMEGIEAVLDAVQRCWASLWTDRAVSYRIHRGFGHDAVELAVVVQEMFPSKVSGVLFTANPITSNPAEFVVNASWGLGEAIVSGHVDPDQLTVARDTMAIVERRIGDKAVMTERRPDGNGVDDVPVPDDLRHRPALTDEELRELCALGRRVEEHYGFPQDVEWGRADGRFVVLQAREITGADLDFAAGLEQWKTPAAIASMYDERWTWSRAYSDEVQTGPSTPSFYTYLQAGMTHLKHRMVELTGSDEMVGYAAADFLDFPSYRWYGARAYYNLALERERIRRWIPPFARDDAALWPFPVDERAEVRAMPFDWDAFLELLQRLEASAPDVSLTGGTRIMYEHLERWTDDEAAFWNDLDLDDLSVAEMFRAQVASRGDSRFGENVTLPFTIYLYLLPQALATACRRWLDDDGSIARRLVGGLGTKTAEENQAVWDLAASVRASTELTQLIATRSNAEFVVALADTTDGPLFQRRLDAFIEEYGHRGGAERDAYHLRWRDDPALVVESVRTMLALEEEDAPAEHERRQRDAMVETRRSALERLDGVDLDAGPMDDMGWLVAFFELTGRTPTDRAEAFDWLVDLVQDWTYYRDFERFYNDKTMSRSRRLYEAIGRRFVAAGLLTEHDDVFFLGREEMRAADRGELTARDLAHRIRSRRRVYERYTDTEPPKYLRGWRPSDDDQVAADGALTGIGASNGVVTGRARVCRRLGDIGTLERGDILVTVATDPGWTTAFSIVGGVVVETGGVVAHAVMISREYGLPCVSNLQRACELIPDGATVTIDGTTGRVAIHDATQ